MTIKSQARWAGVIYVVMSALGVPALLFLPRLIVAGDPAAMSFAFIVQPPHADTIDRIANILIQAELPVILWLVIFGARPAPGQATSFPTNRSNR